MPHETASDRYSREQSQRPPTRYDLEAAEAIQSRHQIGFEPHMRKLPLEPKPQIAVDNLNADNKITSQRKTELGKET